VAYPLKREAFGSFASSLHERYAGIKRYSARALSCRSALQGVFGFYASGVRVKKRLVIVAAQQLVALHDSRILE
jgi:hypothetical protein